MQIRHASNNTKESLRKIILVNGTMLRKHRNRAADSRVIAEVRFVKLIILNFHAKSEKKLKIQEVKAKRDKRHRRYKTKEDKDKS